jgi:hypothetical protein
MLAFPPPPHSLFQLEGVIAPVVDKLSNKIWEQDRRMMAHEFLLSIQSLTRADDTLEKLRQHIAGYSYNVLQDKQKNMKGNGHSRTSC